MNKIYGIAAIVALSVMAVPALSFGQETVSTLRVCTGLTGGNYEYTVKKLQETLGSDVQVEVVNTAGSTENIKKMNSGDCDASMVQSDALYVYNKDVGEVKATKVADMYREYVHFLCRRDSGINDLGGLNETTKVMIGAPGSGANVTWRGMVLADKEFGGDYYSKIPTINGKGKTSDLAKLISDDGAACMIYVGTPGNKLMSMDANKLGAQLVLNPVQDKDFDDPTMKTPKGNVSIWTPAELSYDSYKDIMPSGVFGRKNVETVGVTAVFMIADEWMDNNDDAAGSVTLALPDVKKLLKADKNLSLK